MTLLSKVEEYLKQGRQFALVSVVEVKGSAPQITGAKMIVFQDKSIEGTVGGGKIEKLAISDALEFIRLRTSGLKEYVLAKEGMICGGIMKLFFETYKPQKKLIIVGAGHVGLALYKFAVILGFNITVIDNRKEFANNKRFSNAVAKTGLPDKLLKKENIDKNTYIAIATHNHKFDFVSLKAVVKSDAKYIGMIGSKSKIKQTFNKLSKQGVDNKFLKRVHAPIGLKLGGSSPEEIALCILAQMQAVEYEAKGNLRFEKLV